MSEGKFVLVHFPHLAKVIYSVVDDKHWGKWSEHNRVNSWQEIARGTEDEMWALALLMPDPKTINRS